MPSRFSDPYLTRFLQPDTIIPNLYNPQNLNRYSFVGNNPINRTDPSGHKYCDGEDSSNGCKGVTTGDLKNLLSYQYDWKVIGNWKMKDMEAVTKAAEQIQSFVDGLTGGNGLGWMSKYLGGTNIVHSSNAPSGASWVPSNRDMTNPALITGTGTNTVYLIDNWVNQDGGSRWLAHEMAHIWDINTSPLIPFIGGTGDQLNSAMGGTNQFVCRICEKNGANNNYPFEGIGALLYGNNNTADYLAESFALSVYPDSKNPVPGPARDWVNQTILSETIGLLSPPGFKYEIGN